MDGRRTCLTFRQNPEDENMTKQSGIAHFISHWEKEEEEEEETHTMSFQREFIQR